MATKSHNARKPKLAGHPAGNPNHQMPAGLVADPNAAPEKHKMSFAQHQHELQVEHTASPLPAQEAPVQHMKSDAQQHQQKAGSRK
jgi:hypothetical protein